MAAFKKDNVDLDTLMVKLKLILKGRRDVLNINCTATDACDFVDFLNENEAVVLNKYDRQKMENRFYTFDDMANKKTVTVAIPDVRYFEIPYFFEVDNDNLELKILTINN